MLLVWLRGDRLFGKSRDFRRSLFGVVGLLRGDRCLGESMDDLGDRFLIEIRGDRCLVLLVC
jgi:hypothetical protein